MYRLTNELRFMLNHTFHRVHPLLRPVYTAIFVAIFLILTHAIESQKYSLFSRDVTSVLSVQIVLKGK